MATDRDLPAVATLAEPLRRRLYDYVVGREGPVGRDEAAAATSVSRGLAAFHLDRLADAGLLETSYARLSGRTGPGAGRPAKLYRRADRTFDVSVPPRDYEVPARLLAEVVAAAPGPRRAAVERARLAGVDVGASARAVVPKAGRRTRLAALESVLRDRGFEPRPTGSRELRLANCPFDGLARDHPDLVCRMNHAMLEGVVEGLGIEGVEASLEPRPGSCCVRLRW